MSPYENVIIANSFEEIVFSNRNKEYGAYVLRKKQKRYQIAAFFIAFFMVSSSAITPLIFNYFNGNTPQLNGTEMIPFELDSTINIEPPVAPELKIETARTERFVPPIVVDTTDEEIPMSAMGDLIADNTSIEPPTTIGQPVVEDQVIEIVERPFITVEIPATFDGGDLNNFNKWVSQHMNYPQIAEENGITGKVYIQFVVNAKGMVENVTILRGADPSLNQEAVRVIESSPKWTPPLQGGKPVKQLFSLPVVFKLE